MRLGADPEVFLMRASDGSLMSSIGLIGGNKWAPVQVENLPKGFTLQEDNVTLEFGIPPAASADEFVNHIKTVMEAGLSKVPGSKFSGLSCVIFPESEMQNPLAHMFGCEPDYNAWTGFENPKPEPKHPFMRSAGGHIHVETRLDPKSVARAMDLYLGVPSVLMDSGEERKQLYGKAGAMRFKPYGVEYRTLSNFWIFDDKLIRWAWKATEKALSAVELPGWTEIEQEKATDIQDAINFNKKSRAKELIKEFNLDVCL